MEPICGMRYGNYRRATSVLPLAKVKAVLVRQRERRRFRFLARDARCFVEGREPPRWHSFFDLCVVPRQRLIVGLQDATPSHKPPMAY